MRGLKRLWPIFGMAASLASVACEDGGPPVVSTLVVAPTEVNLEVGETAQLSAVARDPVGEIIIDPAIEWSTRNPFVATVSETGLVTARSEGSTYVVAVFGLADSARIGVTSVSPDFTATTTGGDALGGHTCGLAADRSAYCWGRNGDGQLGTGDTIPSTRPAAVSGTLEFVSLSAGGRHTCGLTTGGRVYCWGANSWGQLGDSTTENRPLPVEVTGDLIFTSVSAGGYHTCAVALDSTVYCWGANNLGQLGTNDTNSRVVPVAVFGGLKFTSVSAGGGHTCGVTLDFEPYCWGNNDGGQLGDGLGVTSAVPVRVAGVLHFRSVTAGGGHSCGIGAIEWDGVSFCWGQNSNGQLGDGTFANKLAPQTIAGGLTFQSLDAGMNHTCGIGAGGSYCWGQGVFGQLGNGGDLTQPSPAQVSGSVTYQSVDAGGGHTCGVGPGNLVLCWGRNSSGELGDGTRRNSTVPIEVINP